MGTEAAEKMSRISGGHQLLPVLLAINKVAALPSGKLPVSTRVRHPSTARRCSKEATFHRKRVLRKTCTRASKT